MLTSAVSLYLLVLISFLLFAVAVGKDPMEAGMMFYSPLAFLVFVMVIPAAFYGIVCGGLVAALFGYADRSTSNLIKASALIGLPFPLLLSLVLALTAIDDPTVQPIFSIGRFLFFLVSWLICSVANLLTFLAAGRISRLAPKIP